MAYSFTYFFWALDQTQSGNYSFFSFTTFHFVHLNNSDWRGEGKKPKNPQKPEYEMSIFKSEKKNHLKKKTVAYVEKQKIALQI